MIAVYPFTTVDQDLALKNARWFNELGGCKGHQVLVIADMRCDPGTVEGVMLEMTKAFDKAYFLPAKAAIDGWPEGANYFFRMAASWMEQRAGAVPFYLWLEPDAIPLRDGWLDMLQDEYLKRQRPFMGDRVQVENIPLHMSGVGIYPNPLHAFAGEAYRAAEVAWDMAGKDQIVSKAHFTKLIEHAWKHPRFTSPEELKTQIRPECVLFHSSKDGSLIDILRGSLTQSSRQIADSSAVQVSGPAPNGLSGREVGATSFPQPQNEVYAGSSPVQAAITCDIFIRTYPGDYQWLDCCLQAIKKYASGFRKVWVVSPEKAPFFDATARGLDCVWKVVNDETPDGYLAQQLTKLYADVITDYQPEYILHIDSDVILTQPVSPENFFSFGNGKPVWYYTPYSEIQTPWQPVTEKFMGFHQPYEFMRRLPMMIPRWLYPGLRAFCQNVHGVTIADYIKMQRMREFSEFNALGAYAYFQHKDKFHWVNTIEEPIPAPLARQFHSWGGITPEVEKEIKTILHGVESCQTPQVLTGHATVAQSETPVALPPGSSAPLQIKELPNGLWVLEGDQISQWVEQEGRLDHDQNLLPSILKHIKPGDTVIDIGAHIGDHTIAYVRAAGIKGEVHAFEPNPVSWECLNHNVSEMVAYAVALGDKSGELVPLSGNNGQPGGGYIGEHMKVASVMMRRLDDYPEIQPDFIKIDVEGYEPRVLDGAEETISKHRPVMVIEVNEGALNRQGFKPSDIFWRLEQHGYDYSVMQENCNAMSPLYDILCLPKLVSAGRASESEIAPVPTSYSSVEEMRDAIKRIYNYSEESLKQKAEVMRCLVAIGLKKPNPNNRRKNAAKNAKRTIQKKAGQPNE